MSISIMCHACNLERNSGINSYENVTMNSQRMKNLQQSNVPLESRAPVLHYLNCDSRNTSRCRICNSLVLLIQNLVIYEVV